MVSNARLDFPQPLTPVRTMSLFRGSSSETFLRLWTRAPRMMMVSRLTVPVTADLLPFVGAEDLRSRLADAVARAGLFFVVLSTGLGMIEKIWRLSVLQFTLLGGILQRREKTG